MIPGHFYKWKVTYKKGVKYKGKVNSTKAKT